MILTHDWLSHHNLNLEILRISNSWIIDRSQSRSLAISVAAIYSALIEEKAIVAFFFLRHAITPLAKVNEKPNVEREKSTFAPQSASAHPCGCWGQGHQCKIRLVIVGDKAISAEVWTTFCDDEEPTCRRNKSRYAQRKRERHNEYNYIPIATITTKNNN